MKDTSTLFYQARYSRRFPVTFLLLERITSQLDAGADDAKVDAVVLSCLKETGASAKPTEEDLTYLATRMTPPESGTIGKPPAINTRTFAGEYLKWVQGLTNETMCLYVAGYNYDEATYLYTEVDHADVLAIAEQKLALDWQVAKVRFEAALFGFGGSYGDAEPEGEGEEVDMAKSLKKMHEMLKL